MKAKKKCIGGSSNPTALASQFLQGHLWTDGNGVHHTLRRHREEYYIYERGRYERRADDTVKQMVAEYLQGYARKMLAKGVTVQINSALISNVKVNVEAVIHVPRLCACGAVLPRRRRLCDTCRVQHRRKTVAENVSRWRSRRDQEWSFLPQERGPATLAAPNAPEPDLRGTPSGSEA